MARDDRRHARKLMKKRSKDRTRRREHAAHSPGSPEAVRAILRQARGFPVHECLIAPGWGENGLAQIILARRQPNGLITFGVYLVDMRCLGLKNTFCNVDIAMGTYEQRVREPMRARYGLEPCPVPLAHKIVHGAIEYAAKLGFRPQGDYADSQYVLDEPGAAGPCEDPVEFGHKGKPLYISGPHDNVKAILGQLDATLGRDGYHFIVGGPADDPRAIRAREAILGERERP